ncbi:MAG: FHA domain-containing protein, partial [Verrucomicrobia bacterium]|nr:FHA domain-containing protein [Verrucomicrobiota bacterium]
KAGALMDKLYMVSGPLMGATAELIGKEITVGRAPDNAICIDDPSVSEHHAVIARKDRECVVKDLSSAKGTYVRGEKVIVASLQDGDKVAFGSVEAQFETTEVKLQLPSKPVVPDAPQVLTWPKRGASKTKAGASAFKAAVLKLVQVAALVGLAAGGYWVYQKLSRVDPFGDAPPAETAKVTPFVTPPSMPASLPPAPQPSQTAVAPAPQTASVAPAAAPTQPAAPAPVAAAPPPSAASTPPRTVSAPTHPVVQQAKLLLAQNKAQDAITSLDKLIASATDHAVVADAQPTLRQALNVQLAALQSAKQQWEAQCKPIEDRLTAAQDKLQQDTKALADKKAAEANIYEIPGGHWRYGYWEGVYYSSRRWVPNTRKGTGDPQAQTAIHELQIKTMTGAQEIKKQGDLVNRYRQQILAFDQQIVGIQSRVSQLDAVLNPAAPATPAAAPAAEPAPAAPK